jgi:hypothetical protein
VNYQIFKRNIYSKILIFHLYFKIMQCKSKLRLCYIMGYIYNILACVLPEEFSVDVYSDHTHTHTHTNIYMFIQMAQPVNTAYRLLLSHQKIIQVRHERVMSKLRPRYRLHFPQIKTPTTWIQKQSICILQYPVSICGHICRHSDWEYGQFFWGSRRLYRREGGGGCQYLQICYNRLVASI